MRVVRAPCRNGGASAAATAPHNSHILSCIALPVLKLPNWRLGTSGYHRALGATGLDVLKRPVMQLDTCVKQLGVSGVFVTTPHAS